MHGGCPGSPLKPASAPTSGRVVPRGIPRCKDGGGLLQVVGNHVVVYVEVRGHTSSGTPSLSVLAEKVGDAFTLCGFYGDTLIDAFHYLRGCFVAWTMWRGSGDTIPN